MLIPGSSNKIRKAGSPSPGISERPKDVWKLAGARTREAWPMLSSWGWNPHSWDSIAGSPGNPIRQQRVPFYENGVIISSDGKLMWPWLLWRADMNSVMGRLDLEHSSSHHLLGNLNQQNQLQEDSLSYQSGYWASAWCWLTTPTFWSQKDSFRWRIKQQVPTKYGRLWVKVRAWSEATWLQPQPLAFPRAWALAQNPRKRNQGSQETCGCPQQCRPRGYSGHGPRPYSLLQSVTQHLTQSTYFTNCSM